ncbi:hypothetical protein GCM10027275_29610 [Rhabdobacter roseus]
MFGRFEKKREKHLQINQQIYFFDTINDAGIKLIYFYYIHLKPKGGTISTHGSTLTKSNYLNGEIPS